MEISSKNHQMELENRYSDIDLFWRFVSSANDQRHHDCMWWHCKPLTLNWSETSVFDVERNSWNFAQTFFHHIKTFK